MGLEPAHPAASLAARPLRSLAECAGSSRVFLQEPAWAEPELGTVSEDDAIEAKGAAAEAAGNGDHEAAVAAFAAGLTSGAYDALVVSAAGRAPHGPVAELDVADARGMMDSKFWTAWHCAKHVAPVLADGGSITFVAGVLNRRPGKNCAPLAATNGALEGLTRSLALDLGPRIRVNCMSPGFCDTERFDHMDAERKAAEQREAAAKQAEQTRTKPLYAPETQNVLEPT